MKDFFIYLQSLELSSLIVFILGIIAIIYFLPNAVKRMNIVKLGPLEIEHRHQSQNYEINREIERIDIENRENMWDMTDDLFMSASESSNIKCEAVVGYVINCIASPIRNIVMLNHIAPKLVKSEEQHLKDKIKRGISRSIRDAKKIDYGDGCPIENDLLGINVEKYSNLIEDWIIRARQITSRACLRKIHVYEKAINDTNDTHWKEIYKHCINKNKGYLKGMGYE